MKNWKNKQTLELKLAKIKGRLKWRGAVRGGTLGQTDGQPDAGVSVK